MCLQHALNTCLFTPRLSLIRLLGLSVVRGRRLEILISRGVVYACKIIGRYQGHLVGQFRPSVFPLLHRLLVLPHNALRPSLCNTYLPF